MTELYLIAHKCRGEPTFDVAQRMVCSTCATVITEDNKYAEAPGCDECSGEGYWWILSVCGYRAYPYWSTELLDLWIVEDGTKEGVCPAIDSSGTMPPNTRDCFAINDRGHKPIPDSRPADLLAKLGLVPKATPIRRL